MFKINNETRERMKHFVVGKYLFKVNNKDSKRSCSPWLFQQILAHWDQCLKCVHSYRIGTSDTPLCRVFIVLITGNIYLTLRKILQNTRLNTEMYVFKTESFITIVNG